MRAQIGALLALSALQLMGCGGMTGEGGSKAEEAALAAKASKEVAAYEKASHHVPRAPTPAPITEGSSCRAFLRATKSDQTAVAATRPGEVGQVAWGYYDTETACKADPTTTVHFAICTAIEDIQQYPGLEAGALAEFRQRYPWCFGGEQLG